MSAFDFYSQEHKVFVLTHPTPAPLFCAKLRDQLRSQQTIQAVDVSTAEPNSLTAQLSTSFLGQTLLFWFGFLGELDAKKKKWILGLLSSYEGPHQIIAVTDEAPKKLTHGVTIPLPDVIDHKQYEQLAALFGITHKVRCPVERPLLETACLLLSYQRLLGAKTGEFVAAWLPKLVTPEQSLYALAQPFFAKQPKLFFPKWTQIMQEYAEPFWVTFWADQLWRAYWFVYYTELGNHAEAKRSGARLPFSFMQRDWKHHSLGSLRAAHDALYGIDFQIKHGASGINFDLFFARFLQGH